MNSFFLVILIIFLYMSTWFVISLLKKRNDLADIAWGLGFILVSWVSLGINQLTNWRSFLVVVLVSVWGFRLAWHVYHRNKGKQEDYRYATWRKNWGNWFYIRSYFQVYLLQGFLLLLISSPILAIHLGQGVRFNILDFLGVLLWALGFCFEALGDYQLANFIKDQNNKGKIMQTGLWRFTRHPNYFGEVLQWWALWLISLNVSGSYWAIIGPLTITYLILKVSGIPLLENKMIENKDFLEYKRKTSIFFPWWPKS